MSSLAISITVQLMPADIQRTILWLTFKGTRSPWRTQIVLLFYILAAAVGVVSIFMSDPETRKDVIDNFSPLFWVGGFLVVWMVAAPYFSARSTFKNRKGLQELTRYTVSEGIIELETATASRKIEWPQIGLAVETKSYFYLFLRKGATLIIPKRAILDEAAITGLREILRESVKGKVRLIG